MPDRVVPRCYSHLKFVPRIYYIGSHACFCFMAKNSSIVLDFLQVSGTELGGDDGKMKNRKELRAS